MAFDWSHQIAKRICNEGAGPQQGVVPWNRKISKIENFMKYWRWWHLKMLFSMNFLRWREFHCLAALAWHIIMWLEERFCRRIIPSPGWLGEFVVKIVFTRPGYSTSNFSKSVNSFRPTVFFPLFFRMWLSIRCFKSSNKCVTPELSKAKLRFHGAGNLANRKF